MKHFRLFSLFFGCWLLASCTADPGTEPGPSGENPPTAENPHAVPVEQALEELQSVLEEIDIPAEDGAVTRSGGIRRVKNVTTVSPEVLNPDGTRSEATADVEDLLYIVNFENEAGYAILGADDRLEPVYAVVDEGSLTTEEFRYAVTITDEQAQADGKFVFPLQLVAQAAIIGIENADTDADGGVAPMSDDGRHTGDLGGDVLRREYVYVTQEKVGPLIPVKWGQGYPFNASVTQINGKCCWAGCSAIAVAQVLVSNYWHYGSVVGSIKGTPIDWTLIRRAIQNPNLLIATEGKPSTLTPEAKAVSMLIYAIGVVLNMDYGLDGSSASLKDSRDGLTYVLYKGVNDHTYRDSYVRTMMLDRKKTTIVRGHSSTGRKLNHQWNIDGWLYRMRYIKTYYRNGTTSISSKEQVPQTLIHCNFGWNGLCNGYYFSGSFNTTTKPVDQESGIDNVEGTQDGNYTDDLRMITYTEIP